MRSAAAVILALLSVPSVSDAGKTVDTGKVDSGNKYYEAGEFDKAMTLYVESLGDTLALPKNAHGVLYNMGNTLFSQDKFGYSLVKDYKILKITEMKSHESPLVQVADLFAGIGAYSHDSFQKYQEWKRRASPQIPLGLFKKQTDISNTDCERCSVLDHLNTGCKKHKLSIALESKKGFVSHKPNMPINFWLYDTQHSEDEAPSHQ